MSGKGVGSIVGITTILIVALGVGGYVYWQSQLVEDTAVASAPLQEDVNSNPDATANTPADWKTYRNEEYGVEFTYPPTLTVTENGSEVPGGYSYNIVLDGDSMSGIINIWLNAAVGPNEEGCAHFVAYKAHKTITLDTGKTTICMGENSGFIAVSALVPPATTAGTYLLHIDIEGDAGQEEYLHLMEQMLSSVKLINRR